MSDPYRLQPAIDRILENQFKKGKSGNPFGRPKGARNTKTIVQEVANERHSYTEDGKTKKLPAAELVLKILQREALRGNLRAAKKLDALREKFGASAHSGEGYGFLVVPEPLSDEEFIAQAEIENNGKRKPGN